MAIPTYRDREPQTIEAAEPSSGRSLGEHVFIWLGWAAAAAFWGLMMTSFAGIVGAAMSPTPVVGGVAAGGIGAVLMDVVGGVVVLGLALAFGMWRFATRDRRLDPTTERATAAVYDAASAKERRQDLH